MSKFCVCACVCTDAGMCWEGWVWVGVLLPVYKYWHMFVCAGGCTDAGIVHKC